MDWIQRIGRRLSPSQPGSTGEVGAVELATPGIAALVEGVAADGSHAVLDLGPAGASSLVVYKRFARRIRFADLPGQAKSADRSVSRLIEAVPPQPECPYDLVFGWNVLDRLYPEYHAPLIARLADVTAPGARLHVVMGARDQGAAPPLRFALLDIGRMQYETAGPPQPALPRLLPAQLADLLDPFRVVHGFTLRGGFREYVAMRTGG